MKQESGRLRYVDCAKGLAIIAVLLDHSQGIVHNSDLVGQLSLFAVSLFVLLGGITMYGALERKKGSNIFSAKAAVGRVSKLLTAYLVACAVAELSANWFFNWESYCKTVFSFAGTGYYYVLFFAQLLLIAPVLYALIKWSENQKHSHLWESLLVLAIGVTAYLCLTRTYFLSSWGAGQYLFGGSFLLLYFVGMLIAKHSVEHSKHTLFVKMGAAIVGLAVTVCLVLRAPTWISNINAQLKSKVSPPGIEYILLAIAILCVIKTLYAVGRKRNTQAYLCFAAPLELCGRYSLTIFLYHTVFMVNAEKVVARMGIPTHFFGKVINGALIFAAMLVGPIVLTAVYKKVKAALIKAVSDEQITREKQTV